MNNALEKIQELTDALVKLDERIGFSRLLKYVLLGLFILLVINFKTVTKEAIEFIQDINEQVHSDKMNKRDALMTELTPVLQEFRTEVKADRLLYFEYHNSKENLVGIPFKYVDLVQQSTKYGIPCASVDNFRDINVGTITNLYNTMKQNQVVICGGVEDEEFLRNYPGTFEMFNGMDGSKRQIFISIPGIKQPIGFIVLEWVEKPANPMTKDEVLSVVDSNEHYVSIINGLILAHR